MTVPALYEIKDYPNLSCDKCEYYSPKIFPAPTHGKCFLDYNREEEQYIIHWVNSKGICPRFKRFQREEPHTEDEEDGP